MMICFGMAVRWVGLLGVSATKMKELIGRDKICCALCIKCMKVIVKYFFLADIFILWFILDLDKYIFPWQTSFYGGHLRLELSCIWVNTVTSVT